MSRGVLRFCLATLVLSSLAHADAASDAQRKRAAQVFDAAVQNVNRAEYQEAAKGFLLADDLAPSSVALSNAIAAARKANDDLLVARAAQRAIDRADSDQKLATAAREALLDVEHRVARIELSCQPTPCTMRFDDETAKAGKRYAVAGIHVATAEATGGPAASERITVVPGGVYRIVLFPTAPTVAAKPAEVHEDAKPKPPPTASASAAPPRDEPPPPRDKTPATDERAGKKPLPPAVVIAGAGVTVVLLGVMTWSGIDTLSAKSNLGHTPTQPAIDDVKSKITRTDILLGAAAIVGVATAVVGVTLVDWGHGSAEASIAPSRDGLRAGFSGRF